jgi:hypothetical protein
MDVDAPEELLATRRSRRSTAGNRLSSFPSNKSNNLI